MAVYFITENPALLLDSFKEKIEAGSIQTWMFDTDGDFTPTGPQWSRRAWFRAAIEPGRLAFYIWPPQGVWISMAIYAGYHGRLVECMLAHFDKDFSEAHSTARVAGKDHVKSSSYIEPREKP